MGPKGALSFCVVCEADADLRSTTCLADRLLADRIEWMGFEGLDHFREWRGLTRSDAYLKWASVRGLAAERRIVVHGHFGAELGEPDAAAARKALMLLQLSDDPPDAVLLIRDTDGNTRRAHGLRQAACESGRNYRFRIVVGAAHTKRECWALIAFRAAGEKEAQRLRALRTELGFDPTVQAEMLTATHDTDLRSAKRVLQVLCEGDRNREAACFSETPLEYLRERGSSVGLTAFLSELDANLLPLFGGHVAEAG